jgi:DtxR family transcriptional regulator, Mn-dependent transcriptional regulator
MATAHEQRNAEDGASRITPATEHYLQAIYALTAERKVLIGARLAQHLRVSAPSVTQTLQRLERDGYIHLIDRGDRKEIHLTEAGLVIGEESTRKHRLIERWLQKELRLSSTEAHEAAEGFEAGFTPLLLDRLYESLGRPQTCPHGNPIPAKGGHTEMDYDGVYLNEVVAGQRVVIGRITEEAEADLDLLAYLERNGVGPNVALTILAVDRMSGAVTAVTGAGKEIRLEGRSAALIWARRAEDAGAQPAPSPQATPVAGTAGTGRTGRTGTNPVPV